MSRPHLVDADHDSARSTGDEPLLLARRAPVAVTPDRAAGARMLVAEGCDFLIMDDGFQSARLRFDRAVLVVDSRRGVGNGRVIPGGPMRAPLIDQLRRADAVIRMGSGSAADEVVRKASRAGKPVYEAITRHRPGSGVEGGAFLAFAGIGDPAKFFDTVREAGGTLGLTKSFADHHYYTDEDLRDLEAAAAAAGLGLVTTAKDAVRIRRRSPYADGFLKRLHVLEIEAEFVPANVGTRIIRDTMAAYEERAIGA
jgi:tetraacyldisaccharide 4'-kinase